MKKKVNIKNLVEEIAKLARERASAGPVVSLEDFRGLGFKKYTPTILLIEDDEIMRKSLKRIFESENITVLAASDGAELSSLLHETPIDLIILDVGLPWINGYELAEMMKTHPDLRPVPLVFISGHNDHEAIKKGFAVGAHDYITKPFDIEKIKKTIHTILELSAT